MKGADDLDGATAAEAALRNIHSEKLARLLMLEDELRANKDRVPMEMSVPKWNALQDRWNRAADELTHDSDLLEQLCRAVPATVDRRDRALLAQLLSVPLDEIPAEKEAILADPRVGLTAGQVGIAPAVYLVDIDSHPEDVSLYEVDNAEPDEPYHDLTRMGGRPTVGPWGQPDSPFILQVDLGTALYEDTTVGAFVTTTSLPAGGLVQLFHSTTGDSRTDSDSPGGGATLVYVPESALQQRTRADGEELFAARRIQMMVLPTFRFGTDQLPDATSLAVIALQERADAIARRGTRIDEEAYAARTDPLAEKVPSVTRLFGLPWFDSDDSQETRDLLAKDLPLSASDDHHVLLFDVSSDTVLDGIFGDSGRLEIWVRASDLAASNFSHVVSFIRST